MKTLFRFIYDLLMYFWRWKCLRFASKLSQHFYFFIDLSSYCTTESHWLNKLESSSSKMVIFFTSLIDIGSVVPEKNFLKRSTHFYYIFIISHRKLDEIESHLLNFVGILQMLSYKKTNVRGFQKNRRRMDNR